MKISNFIFLLFYYISAAVVYQHVQGEPIEINGYTSESLILPNPFKIQYDIKISTLQQMNNIQFTLNQLRLKKISQKYLGNQNNTLLQNLRTPQQSKFKQIIISDDHVFLFKQQNASIIIFKQINDQLVETATVNIVELHSYNLLTKGYKFKDKILIFYNSFVFVINKSGNYTKLDLKHQNDNLIAHVQQIYGTDYILLAQYSRGFSLYKIKPNSIELIKQYDQEFFNVSLVSIEDINFQEQGSKDRIYILDRFSGIHQITIDLSTLNISYTRKIWQQKGCTSMDTQKNQYIILLCQQEHYQKYITQLILYKNGTVRSLKPLFKKQYIFDVEMSQQYYLTFSNKVLNTYWNSKKHHIPEEFRFANGLSIPGGINQIKLIKKWNKHYLYVLKNYQIEKYIIQQIPPIIYYKTQKIKKHNVTLQIFGPCESLQKSFLSNFYSYKENIKLQKQYCIYQAKYLINIKQMKKMESSEFNLALSTVLLILIVLVIITIVCLYKYRRQQLVSHNVLRQIKIKSGQIKFQN